MLSVNHTNVQMNKLRTSKPNPQPDLSFRKYGLNPFKNFLDPQVHYFKNVSEIDKYANTILSSLWGEGIETDAALFFDCGYGRKRIYELTTDYEYDPEFNDFLPVDYDITCYSIAKDFTHEAFAHFDFESRYEVYGLLVKVGDSWVVVNEF